MEAQALPNKTCQISEHLWFLYVGSALQDQKYVSK